MSGTRLAQSSFGVTPIAGSTGQAVGIAAALSAKGRFAPRSLDSEDVRRTLREPAEQSQLTLAE